MHHRTAFVTGASSGLGAGIARRLAERGTRVWAAARRVDRLTELARSVDGEIIPVALDVRDTSALVRALREIDEAAGGLDLVVANAGVNRMRHAARISWEEDVEPVLAVNVIGAIATLSALLPAMLERGRGHLVGISSLAAARGLPASAAYSASKAALSTYLESLRVDLAGTGVVVTTVHPGFVRTELTEDTKAPMPFLMDLEPAVDRIVTAIDAEQGEVSFPWPMAALVGAARVLPAVLYEPVARRLLGGRRPRR